MRPGLNSKVDEERVTSLGEDSDRGSRRAKEGPPREGNVEGIVGRADKFEIRHVDWGDWDIRPVKNEHRELDK